jgi:hypothetical protein
MGLPRFAGGQRAGGGQRVALAARHPEEEQSPLARGRAGPQQPSRIHDVIVVGAGSHLLAGDREALR